MSAQIRICVVVFAVVLAALLSSIGGTSMAHAAKLYPGAGCEPKVSLAKRASDGDVMAYGWANCKRKAQRITFRMVMFRYNSQRSDASQMTVDYIEFVLDEKAGHKGVPRTLLDVNCKKGWYEAYVHINVFQPPRTAANEHVTSARRVRFDC